MVLFFISFLLVFVSSYLITSVFAPKKYAIGFLYFLLISFAQIVLSLEILSLFSLITPKGVLGMNVIFLIASLVLWNCKKRPLYVPQIFDFLKELKKIIFRDKVLFALCVGFLVFMGVAITMNTFLPINSFDALNYHLARVPFWISNHNLLHFDIADDRALVFPINSELLYSWVLVFMKDDWGISFFSFFAYIASCVTLYNLLGFFKFSKRKALWSVFVLGTLASVLSQATSSETDLLIGALVLVSIFLYLFGLKEKKNTPIYFSALAYALAIGTKTPAVLAIPAVGFLMITFSVMDRKKEFYKPFLTFLGFGILNFILFSSFNYILNFINYSNFMGNASTIQSHRFFGGPEAFISNFIKYIFMFIDFSGFRYGEFIGKDILHFRNAFLMFIGIDPNVGVIVPEIEQIANETLDVKMGSGLLGFLIYLPCLFYALIKPFFTKFAKKSVIIAIFAATFFINLMVLSTTLGYMIFSVRFITFFMVVSSPILVLSYIKKTGIVKLLFMFIILSYFTIIASNFTGKPFIYLTQIYKENHKNIYTLREKMRCSDTLAFDNSSPFCQLKVEILNNYPKGSKIGVFATVSDRMYVIKMLEKVGYKVDLLLIEKLDGYDISSYDYLVTTNRFQESVVIHNYPQGLKNYYLSGGRTVRFKPGKYARCVYYAEDGSVIMGVGDFAPKIEPAYTQCTLPQVFYAKNEFELMKTIDVKSAHEQGQNTFKIYKNKNR